MLSHVDPNNKYPQVGFTFGALLKESVIEILCDVKCCLENLWPPFTCLLL